MSNFKKVDQFFPKGMEVALASKHPLALVLFSGEVGIEVEIFLNIIQAGEVNGEESKTNNSHKIQKAYQVGKSKVPKEE